MRGALAAILLVLVAFAFPVCAGNEPLEPANFLKDRSCGDWSAVSIRTHEEGRLDPAPNFVKLRVQAIDHDDVQFDASWARLAPEKTEKTFDMRESPLKDAATVAEYVGLLASEKNSEPADLKLEPAKRTIAGRVFECVRATFTTTSSRGKLENALWVSAEPKGYGLVAWEARTTGERAGWTRTVELTGFGTSEATMWGKTALEARAALCDDDRRLPLNPHANAHEGDWCALVCFDANEQRSTTEVWTVTFASDDTAAFRVECGPQSWTFARSMKEPPTIREYLSNGAACDYFVTNMNVEDAEYRLPGGKKLVGKRVTATLTQVCGVWTKNGTRSEDIVAEETIWLCPDVKGSGVADRGTRGHLLGYGSKDETAWGRTAAEVQKIDEAWRARLDAANAAARRGDGQGAQKQLDAALAEAAKGGETDVHLPPTLELLAGAAAARRDLAEAERLLKRSIATLEAMPGVHDDVAPFLALGRVCDAQRRFDEAESHLKTALQIETTAHGASSGWVFDPLVGLGRHYHAVGKHAEAASAFERATRIGNKEFGEGSTQVAGIVPPLLGIYLASPRYADAEKLARSTLDGLRAQYPNSVACAEAHRNLAFVLEARGKYAQAVPFCEKALEMWDARRADESTASLFVQLAILRQHLHENEKAERLFDQALAIQEGLFGKDDGRLCDTLAHAGSLQDELGQPEKAASLYGRAIEIGEKAFGKDDSYLALPLAKLGALERARGKLTEADTLLRRALAICERAWGPEHPLTARCLSLVGELRIAQDDDDGAEQALSKALAVLEKELGPKHQDLLATLKPYAAVEKKLKKVDEATKLEARIAEIEENDPTAPR